MRNMTNKKGFTLIELLVVIAILGILVALAAPRFIGYTKDAKVTAMETDIRVLENIAEMHNIETEDWPVDYDNPIDLSTISVELNGEGYKFKADSVEANLANSLDQYVLSPSHKGNVFYIPGRENKNGDTYYDIGNKNFTPGPNKLMAGDVNTGFFGEVSSSQFITGDDLANQIGLTDGEKHNSDVEWMKFMLDGRVLFIPKKTLRYNLSWESIDLARATTGTKVITVNGQTYSLRLMTGNGANSEWNKLMYPVFNDDWGINYSGEELGLTGNGRSTWMQDSPGSSLFRIVRGDNNNVSYVGDRNANSSGSNFGWRPVLEYVNLNN